MACTLVTPPAARSLIRNPIFITLESDLFTGSEAPYTPSQDNLQCLIEVWRETTGPEDEFIARNIAPYSRTSKQVTFDIADLLVTGAVALPSEASIGVTGTGIDPLSGEAVGLVSKFRIKYGDQYGDPVTPETLTVSGYYVAIAGGLPADHRQSINYAGKLIPLHSYLYRRDSAYTFYKPVGATQPDWMYFISLLAGTIQVKVTIHYEDGTYEFVDSHTIAVVTNRAYWMQSGYAQLKVEELATQDKVIVAYDVSLIDVATDQNAFTVFYLLDMECPSWDKVLLYHNGIGGYETVRMKGKTTYGHAVETEQYERTRWTDFDIKTGSIDMIRTAGSPVFTLSTGHYPPWYLDHLRQLLHGRLWMIDSDLSALSEHFFKRIICDTGQVEVRKDDPSTPESFVITCRNAWRDDGFNIY